MLRTIVAVLAVLVPLAGFVDFFWFLGEVANYGGGPGPVRDGHYFLMNHGVYTEVSQAVWERLQLHEVTVFVLFPLALLSFAYLLVRHVMPALAGLRQGPVVDERVRAVRASGGILAGGRYAGSIAGFRLGFPAIEVSVYPGGLTVRLPGGRPWAILRAEVRHIESKRFRVTIDYVSPDAQGPLVLAGWPWSGERMRQLNAALAQLTESRA